MFIQIIFMLTHTDFVEIYSYRTYICWSLTLMNDWMALHSETDPDLFLNFKVIGLDQSCVGHQDAFLVVPGLCPLFHN